MDREAYEEMALGAVEVAAFSLIANKLDKYVKQSARNTIALNASNDPRCRGYRRVASPTACEFCRQQADEGIVTSGDGGSFHAGCGCQNEPVFGGERKASDGVSSGVHGSISAAWYKQFKAEEMWVERVDGSKFYKEGNPRNVPITDDEAKSIVGGKARHTHTTTVDGTFGEDDIELTVKLELSEHEVLGTLTGGSHRLVRLESATKELGDAFIDDYYTYSGDCLASIKHYIGERDSVLSYLSDDQLVEAETMLKSYQHNWLKENAIKYGYLYN